MFSGVRNIVAIILGAFMTIFIKNILEYNFVLALLTFTTTTLFIMNNNSTSKIFKFIKNICCLRNGISFYIILYNGSKYIVNMEHYITGSIIVGFISIIIFNISSTKKTNNLKRTFERFLLYISFFVLTILICGFLYNFLVAINNKTAPKPYIGQIGPNKNPLFTKYPWTNIA